MGQRDLLWCDDPGCGHGARCDGLIERDTAGCWAGAHIGDVHELKHFKKGTIFAKTTVQHGKHDGTVVGTQGFNERGVNIGFHDFVSDPPQRLCNGATRLQRDVALVAESSGKDDDWLQHAPIQPVPGQ